MEPQTTETKLSEQIIGTWKLVSWTFENQNGETINYFGDNPTGILMYTDSGYMSVHIMKENRTPFKSEGMYDGEPEEIIEAFNTYFAYFGKYVENEPGVFTHTVEGGTFPNWLGNTEVRYGKIEGDRLILSTPPIPTEGTEIVFNVEWQRT